MYNNILAALTSGAKLEIRRKNGPMTEEDPFMSGKVILFNWVCRFRMDACGMQGRKGILSQPVIQPIARLFLKINVLTDVTISLLSQPFILNATPAKLFLGMLFVT